MPIEQNDYKEEVAVKVDVKLAPDGRGVVFILDHELLQHANIHAGTELEIVADGHSIIMTPVVRPLPKKATVSTPSVEESMQKVFKKYAPALKKLANC